MATYTENYNLKKPDRNENYTIVDFNENYDLLDEAIADAADKVDVLINLLAPVGVILTFANDTDPNVLFQGTTWVKIKDKFLLGQGDTYNTLGATGGSADAIVVSHSHTAQSAGGHSHTANSAGAHTHSTTSAGAHTHTAKGWHGIVSGSTWKCVAYEGQISGDAAGTTSIVSGGAHTHTANSAGAHTHSTTTAGAHTHSTDSQGSAGTGKNMPPYVVVAFWQRTA